MGELKGTFVWRCEDCRAVVIEHTLDDLKVSKSEHRCRKPATRA